jgi:hypothetical protein
MPWELLAVIGILVLLDYAWTSLFRRVRKGRFRVRIDDAQAFSFDSNFGHFRIDREHKRVVGIGKRGRVVIPFAEIAGLRYSHDDEWAVFSEWFFGFDITDVLTRYRDTAHWFTISIRKLDGSEIPLFVAGQLEQREFLLGWYIELQVRILGALGLFHDIDEYCRQVLERLQAQFQSAGLRLQLLSTRRAST